MLGDVPLQRPLRRQHARAERARELPRVLHQVVLQHILHGKHLTALGTRVRLLPIVNLPMRQEFVLGDKFFTTVLALVVGGRSGQQWVLLVPFAGAGTRVEYDVCMSPLGRGARDGGGDCGLQLGFRVGRNVVLHNLGACRGGTEGGG